MLKRFIQQEQLGALKYDAKFIAELLKVGEMIFVFPQTFMNLSGNAVASIARYYNIIPEDILVLHDEIELPLGKIALKS
jgi:PTH1 family peptidyl-tRNA hydrolase